MASVLSGRDHTLAGAWRPAVRRLLFFTYRFDFRWFHDCVLSLARRQSMEGVQIDVLVTRRATDQVRQTSLGDLYALDEWAKWQRQVQIHYMRPRRHLFHNKFILVEHFRTGTIELGLGSSNLTNAGWARNFETWTWTRGPGLHACAAFLRYLQSVPDVNGSVLAPWIKKLESKRPDAWHWLWGQKADRTSKTFRALGRGIQRPARIVRIASPYYDKDSLDLLNRLLADGGLAADRPKLEIWIDGSGAVGRPIDYEYVGQIAKKYGPSCRVMKVMRKGDAKDKGRVVPLHAKVIEVQGADGSVSRLLGSANFTGAAWLRSWNTESVQLERDRNSLEGLLAPGLSVAPVTHRELTSLRDNASDGEGDDAAAAPAIYWAAFDETLRPRTLTICYQADSSPVSFTIEAAFDPSRANLDGKDQRDALVAAFQDPRNWKVISDPQSGAGLLRLAFLASTTVPELALVCLRFKDGTTLRAPVEISAPDFSRRDASTGIPIAASIEAVLGRGTPIVPPRNKRTLAELTNVEDDSGDEEIPLPANEDRLAADPDYRREPLAVRMAKLVARVKGKPEQIRRIGEQCDALSALPASSGDLALAKAVKKAVAGE